MIIFFILVVAGPSKVPLLASGVRQSSAIRVTEIQISGPGDGGRRQGQTCHPSKSIVMFKNKLKEGLVV